MQKALLDALSTFGLYKLAAMPPLPRAPLPSLMPGALRYQLSQAAPTMQAAKAVAGHIPTTRPSASQLSATVPGRMRGGGGGGGGAPQMPTPSAGVTVPGRLRGGVPAPAPQIARPSRPVGERLTPENSPTLARMQELLDSGNPERILRRSQMPERPAAKMVTPETQQFYQRGMSGQGLMRSSDPEVMRAVQEARQRYGL